MSLKDLAALTRTSLSEDQLRSTLEAVPDPAFSYHLRNGFIIQYGNDGLGKVDESVMGEREKQERAESYARYATEFASLCNARGAKVLAISGSTSYKTPFASDDLDIFCVTKQDGLWIFLTRSLLLARFLQFTRRNAPRLCFSYAVDQKFVEKEFAIPRDALFARDALTTTIVHGQEYYRELLKKSPWMSNYFPHLYHHRTDSLRRGLSSREQTISRPITKFLNTLLWLMVGNYVAFKSVMLNTRLRKQGRLLSVFSAKIGVDHCVFESVRYSKLRTMYLQLYEKSKVIQRGEHPATR